MSAYVPNDLLSRLIGLQMNQVVFIMDYLQLTFQPHGYVTDTPYLTCNSRPEVVVNGKSYRDGDTGYGDALRSLVMRDVTATAEATASGLTIEFASDQIKLNPNIEDVIVEIAMLGGFEDKAWMVWRPGDEAFEHLMWPSDTRESDV